MKTAKNILIVIGLAALAWVLWPALSGAAAAIMGGQTVYHTQPGPMQPQAQPAPQTGPALPPAALPTAVQPVQPMPVQPVQPVQVQPVQPTAVQPVQVDQVQPMPTDQVLTAAGWVDRVTAEFWADCAHGQAAGRRVSPRCPANAGEMLGGGR